MKNKNMDFKLIVFVLNNNSLIMNNKYIHYLSFLFFTSCVVNQTQQDLTFDGDFYTIDLDEEKVESIPLTSIFKDVRTIILETREDCLIGRIESLQVFDERIYILDSRKAKSLFVFDMEGKFIQKIGSYGNGPGEYNEPLDFLTSSMRHPEQSQLRESRVFEEKIIFV